MKSRITRKISILFAVVAIVSCSILSMAFTTAGKIADDVWSQLGIEKMRGTGSIKESFLYGYLQYYGASNAKRISSDHRSVVAKDLLQYTKQYVQGESFKKEYDNYRISMKPNAPDPAKTEEEVRKQNIESTKEGIANLEKGMKTATEEIKKMMKPTYEMFQQQLKDFQDPNSQMIKMIVQSEKMQYEFRVKDYEKKTEEWKQAYPESHLYFIKGRLEQLLEATADIDFNAQLTEKYGKKYFVNPAYERKNSNWKMAFRAGKEVTETVRSFAKQWVSEIK